MQLKLSDLRALGAMAQFNKREMRPDVLKLIETTGHLPGDARVVMTPKSCHMLYHPDVIDQDPPDDHEDDEEETLPLGVIG